VNEIGTIAFLSRVGL